MKKRNILITVAVVLTMIFSSTAFAGVWANPGEIVSSLTEKTETDVLAERNAGKTYRQIAQENGVWEEFRIEMLDYKKSVIDQRVADGVISTERGNKIKEILAERIASCTGTPDSNREKLGMGFGRGNGKGQGFGTGQKRGMEKGNGYGAGQGMGFGRTSSNN